MKKIIPNIVMIVLAVLLCSGRTSANCGFDDVKEDDWHSGYVKELQTKGIVNGFPDNTFRPEDQVSRSQFIKMVVTAMGFQAKNSVGHWAKQYMEKAKQAGLTVPVNEDAWDQAISRGEASVNLSEALDYMKREIGIEKGGLVDLYGYTPSEYLGHVLKVYNAGIITGYPDRTFGYDKKITRAESCAVIYRLATPITGREYQFTSNKEVPAWYSYNNTEFDKYLNDYEGNSNCKFENGRIFCKGQPVQTGFNPAINENIREIVKILLDGSCSVSLRCTSTVQKNIIEIACYPKDKRMKDSRYSLFSLKFYDAPTGYPEKNWGYDTMFVKLEVNRLADEGLLDPKSGQPSAAYEYKIKGLARYLFGEHKGDFFSKNVIDIYKRFSGYEAGAIPVEKALLETGDIKSVFFTEGGSRRLNFTFTEGSNEK